MIYWFTNEKENGGDFAPVLAILLFGGEEKVAPLRQEDDYFYEDYEGLEKVVYRPKKKVLPSNSPKIEEVKKVSSKPKIKGNVFLGVVGFGIALTIVLRYAMINNMNMENIRLKNELQNINNTNAQLKLAAEQKVNLSEIEAYAKEKWGLQKPQNYQIEYINIDKHDLIDNKTSVIEKKGIMDIFNNIVEFFY